MKAVFNMEKSSTIEKIEKLISANKYTDARSLFEEYADSGNMGKEYAEMYIKILRLNKDFDKALDEAYKLLDSGAMDAAIFTELGLICQETHQYEKAIKYFEEALELEPDKTQILFETGKAYKNMRDYSMASRKFEDALAGGYSGTDIHRELGWTYYWLGEYDNAAGAHSKILTDPGESEFFRNTIKNELEFFERKDAIASKLRRLRVCLTTDCNIKCIMCEIFNRSWTIPRRIVDEIISFFPYLEYVQWLGGEVFMYEHFEELFCRAIEYPELWQMINTNGLLLDDNWIKKILDNNVVLDLSIDGITKTTYEKIRRGAKFDDLTQILEKIKDYRKRSEYMVNRYNNRIFITMNFTVMRSNYREISGLPEFARDYGIDVIYLNPIQGDYGKENIFVHGDQEALKQVKMGAGRINEKAKTYGLEVHDLLPHSDTGEENERTGIGVDNISRLHQGIDCCLPWQQLFIHDDGRVKPDCLCLKEIGNIGQNSLTEIWNGDMMRSYRKSLINNSCSGFCNERCLSGCIDKKHLGFG